MTSEEHMGHPTEALSAHLDGELTEAERHVVEQHLGTCADCAALFADLQRLDQAIAGEEVPDVPADLAALIARRIGVEGAAGTPPVGRRRRLPGVPLALAASLFAAGILYVAWQRSPVEMIPVEVDSAPSSQAPAAPPARERESETPAEPTSAVTRPAEPARPETVTSPVVRAKDTSKPPVAPGPSPEGRQQLAAKAAEESFAASDSVAAARARAVQQPLQIAGAAAEGVEGGVEGGVKGGVAGGVMGGVPGGMLQGALGRALGRSLRLEGAGYQMTLAESGTLKMTSGAYECTVDLTPAGDVSAAENAQRNTAIADLFRRAGEGVRERADAAQRSRSGPSVFLVAPDSPDTLVAWEVELAEAIRALALVQHGELVRKTCEPLPVSITGETDRP